MVLDFDGKLKVSDFFQQIISIFLLFTSILDIFEILAILDILDIIDIIDIKSLYIQDSISKTLSVSD